MKAEYDFSKAARGKFFEPGASLRLPLHLDQESERTLGELAAQTGKSPAFIVRQALRHEAKRLLAK